MLLTEEKQVAEIVAEMPGAARLFEKYQIDYCCGGKRPVGEVCREKGLELGDIQAALAALAAPAAETRDWSTARLADLIGHIVATHHDYLRTEMPRLQELLAKLVSKRYEALAGALEIFGSLRLELENHLWKEERVLFPYIVGLEAARAAGRQVAPPPFGTVRNPIQMMEAEHDGAGDALRRLREAAGGYAVPEGVCNTYRATMHSLEEFEADLHMHIHLENNILHPRATALE